VGEDVGSAAAGAADEHQAGGVMAHRGRGSYTALTLAILTRAA
jgi:hypothetical protein